MEPEVERQVFFLNMHGFIWPAAGTDEGDSITSKKPGGISIDIFKKFIIPPRTTLYLHNVLGECYRIHPFNENDTLYEHSCKVTKLPNYVEFNSGILFPNISLFTDPTKFESGIFKCDCPEDERIVIDYNEEFTGPKKNYMSEYIRDHPEDEDFKHNSIKLMKNHMKFSDNILFFYDTTLDSVIQDLRSKVGEDTHIDLHLLVCTEYFDTPKNRSIVKVFNKSHQPKLQETLGKPYLGQIKSKKYKSKKIRVKDKSKKYKSKKMRVKGKSKKDKSKKVRVKGKIKSK